MSSKTICVMIGNSDDPRQLSQAEWHQYCDQVDRAITRTCRYQGTQVHGRFYSLPNEQWQNACWCIEVDDDCRFVLDALRLTLAEACHRYRQRSIAWIEGDAEMLAPIEPPRPKTATETLGVPMHLTARKPEMVDVSLPEPCCGDDCGCGHAKASSEAVETRTGADTCDA